jgi:hypothetical protein
VQSSFKTSIAISILLSACGGGDSEDQVLGAFFDAVQKGDRAAVERVSVAPFDGTLESGPESEAPFQLADLEARLEAKRDEVSAQRQANTSFVSDNRETYASYTAKYAEDPSAPFQGTLLAFHQELQEKQTRLAQLQVDAEQMALEVEALRKAATMSLSTPVDASFEGQVKVKPIQVKINDGSGDKTYAVVLQRYELVDTGQNRTPTPRWIIAEIQPNS